MKVVATSDTHGRQGQINIPEGDVLVHCGDFSTYGHREDYEKFLEWFAALPHKHKLFTFGNHDMYGEKKPYAARQMVPEGVTLLVDEAVTIDGVKFYGAPWTPRFGNWAFMSDRGTAMQMHWDKIPLDTDVLFTHGPPYGHGDLCPPYRSAYQPHAGCIELLLTLRRVRPKVHLFGHIHGGYGVSQSQDFLETLFVNVAACDEDYAAVQPPVVIDVH